MQTHGQSAVLLERLGRAEANRTYDEARRCGTREDVGKLCELGGEDLGP